MMYEISFDAAHVLLRLRLTGFWTGDVMRNFRSEILETLEHLERAHSSLAILSDCTDYPVQPLDVVEGWSQLLGKGRDLITQPYAIVVGSILNKMQAQRALDAPNVRVFTDTPAAENWLASQR